MGCCGKKKAEWLHQINSSSIQNFSTKADLPLTAERELQVFEYVGAHHLTVKGVHSRNVYRFRFPGDRIEVLYEDSFALMAERDLKRCRRINSK